MADTSALMLLVLSLLASGTAYPGSLTCDRPLAVGETIMGKAALESTSRTTMFKRGGTLLACGGTFTKGEKLTAHISDSAGEQSMILLQLGGGTFSNGTCDGKRNGDGVEVKADGSEVTAPSSNVALTLFAGFAIAGGEVRVTKTCTLTMKDVVASGTPAAGSWSLAVFAFALPFLA